MQAVDPQDQLFLWLEKRHQPMHVGGLQLVSTPEDAPDDYVARLTDSLRQHTAVTAPFNRRLGMRYGQLVWKEDASPDLFYHVRRHALPQPGRIRELLAFISAEHSHLLDREQPLWEVHLIEGLPGRRFALYTKVHHALVDGVSAMRVLQRMLSDDPALRELEPFWSRPARHRPEHGLSAVQGLLHLVSQSGRQLGTLPAVGRELLRTIQEARREPGYDSVFHAPPCILNRKISGSRRFAAQSFDMSRLRAAGAGADATLNDVALAICAGALRKYLKSLGELPDRSLIAMVPVSLRHDDSSEGNQVGVILTPLGTDIGDPFHRLVNIRHHVRQAKDRYRAMSPEEILNYNALVLAPAGFHLLTGLAPKWQTFNVVISNVPGPDHSLYWNGARMEGLYPVSIAMDRLSLNITLTSYNGQVEFGLIGCGRSLPSMQRMLDYLDEELGLLEQASHPKTGDNP